MPCWLAWGKEDRVQQVPTRGTRDKQDLWKRNKDSVNERQVVSWQTTKDSMAGMHQYTIRTESRGGGVIGEGLCEIKGPTRTSKISG